MFEFKKARRPWLHLEVKVSSSFLLRMFEGHLSRSLRSALVFFVAEGASEDVRQKSVSGSGPSAHMKKFWSLWSISIPPLVLCWQSFSQHNYNFESSELFLMMQN